MGNAIGQLSGAQKLAWAGIHEVRTKILTHLTEQGPASPTEMARAKTFRGVEIGTVSYHCRKLLDVGLIAIAEEIPRRGATEHVYRPVERPLISTEEWETMHPILRQGFTGHILELHWRDIAEAVNAGTVDARADRHVTRTPAVVDEEGWKELNAICWDALTECLDAIKRAGARLEASGEPGIRVAVNQMCFELPS